MLLFELFEDDSIQEEIRNLLLDILTPMVSSQVPFVSIDSIIDKLNDYKFGIVIDKNLVMTVLNPNDNKIIDRIDGDKVYFSIDTPHGVASEDEVEKDKNHVSKLATDQAKKSMKDN